MLTLLIKSVLRLILKNKLLALVKIIGLTLGTVVFLLTGLFCAGELKFDTQHERYNDIYRYVHRVNTPDGIQNFAFTSATTGPALIERFSEVVDFTRLIFPLVSVSSNTADVIFYERKFGFADANFFKLFNFQLAHGSNPDVVLKEPLNVVLTPASASRYFGLENPIGKTLLVSGELVFTVTGVLKEDPTASHINFEFIASFSSLEVIKNHPVISQQIPASLNLESKGFNAFYTYLQLSSGSTPGNLEGKFPEFIEEFRGKGRSERLKPFLQGLGSIHLESNLLYEIQPNGSLNTVLVFLFVGLLIILIACINYINISTAEFINRAPGTGLKKILGVTRVSLLVSHLAETSALALLSLLMSCLIVWIVLPGFNSIVMRQIEFLSSETFLLVLCVFFVVVVFSGTYPAITISRIQTMEALKGVTQKRSSAFSMRNVLVFIQLLASFCLLAISFIIGDQLKYLLNKDPGFEARQVIVINAISADPVIRATMKTELIADQSIQAVGMCSIPPGESLMSLGISLPENSSDEDRRIGVYQSFVDHDFLNALGVSLKDGRFFHELTETDTNAYVIINEAAAKQIGTGVMNRALQLPGVFAAESVVKNVVGIFSDFNFASFHDDVKPLVLEYGPEHCNYFLVRIDASEASEVIDHIHKKWKAVMPMIPFDYAFLDQKFAKFYRNEQYQKQIISCISVISILLASLGIFGTTLFLTERKSKEVGVRKVLGADMIAILLMLFKPTFYLLLFSCGVAVPVARVLGDEWLRRYPFRIQFSPQLFVSSFLIMLAIVVLTVLYHFLKITRINPTEVLRQGN